MRHLTRRRRIVEANPEGVAAILAAVLVLGLTAIVVLPGYTGASPKVGQPSASDIVAPYEIAYTSEVLTEAKRDAAERSVPPVFAPLDTTVAAEQRGRARQVLQHVANVRANPYLTDAERALLISSVPEFAGLPRSTLDQLWTMDDAEFSRVQVEVPSVVGLRMRTEIRPDSVPVPALGLVGFVDPAMDDATAQLVAELAAPFVAPNTRVDEEATAAAKEAARASVEPETVHYVAGQTIVREGDPLSAVHLEAMDQFGLLRPAVGWRDVVGVLAFAAAMVLVAGTSLEQLKPGFWRHSRTLTLVVLSLLAFAFAARMVVPEHVVLGYAFPAAALGMTLTVLLGLETGMLTSIVLAVMMGFMAGGDLETAVFVLLGSIAGSVVLGHVERFTAFLVAGLAVAVVDLSVIAGFHLADPLMDLRGVSELIGASIVNATLSAGLAALGALAAGALFGVTTSIQLLELARPNQPLLRQLQLRAPGTYQHSLLISNLAEAAASAVGADALLVRVASYYHDVGKVVRPYFFIENQLTGHNPHDGLDPHASARIIIAHVPEGAELARQAGLPEPIIDGILQHHGTTRVEYFYHKAVQELGEESVDEAAFRYPGPLPQSPEMAILMLADASEAAVRAASPDSSEEIDSVLRRIIQSRLNAGQLQDSELTLSDLKRIRGAFVDVFKSVYHPRIQYPEGVLPADEQADAAEEQKEAAQTPAGSSAREKVSAGGS